MRDMQELFARSDEWAELGSRYEANRRLLGSAYLDYIFRVSPAAHAISLPLASFVLSSCEALRPRTVLDLGSGFSSYVLRTYAAAAGGVRAVSVDDDAEWLARTAEFVRAARLPADELLGWDDFARSSDTFDFVLYDLGAWGTRIRHLPHALRRVAPGGLLVLDDLHVDGYRAAVEQELADAGLAAYDVGALTSDEFGRYSWAVVA